MARLNFDDLAQMNRDYFQSLDRSRLVEVAANLHQLAVEQWERLEQNSKNSSRPPEEDNPYKKAVSQQKEETSDTRADQEPKTNPFPICVPTEQSNNSEDPDGQSNQAESKKKKSPGKQPGTPGKWRSTPLVAEAIIPHHPSFCAACNQPLTLADPKPYMGHYLLELEKGKSGFCVVCQLHHYYRSTCSCGHVSTLNFHFFPRH
ncbi:MAG: DUF6444 domain-containing protein [Xenococcaceae cyanobacterium]